MTAALACLLALAQPASATPGRRLDLVPVSSARRIELMEESPSGDRLLTHDRSSSPVLWDPRSMRVLRVLSGHPEPPFLARFSEDGSHILTASDQLALIWESRRARTLARISAPDKDKFSFGVLSQDGKRFALGTEGGKLLLSDGLNTAKIRTLSSHSGKVWDASFSPDFGQVVTVGEDGTVRLWDFASGMAVGSPISFKARWARFSSDGKQLLVTGREGAAKLFDVGTGKEQFSLPHVLGDRDVSATMMAASFVGKDRQGVLTCTADGTMKVFDRKSGSLLRDLKGHTDVIREIRYSTDGLYAGTYGTDNKLKLWDIEGGKELPFTRPGGDDTYLSGQQPTGATFATQEPIFWVGYTNGSVRRHDLRDGSVRGVTFSGIRPITEVTFVGDDRMIIEPDFHEETGGDSYYWMPAREPSGFREMTMPWGYPYPSPDGKRVYVRHDGPVDSLLNGANGQGLMGYRNVEGWAWSPDSKFFVTTHSDQHVTIWDAETGKFTNGWQWKNAPGPFQLAVSPDGKTALSNGHLDQHAILWNLETGEASFSLGEVPKEAALAFRANGKEAIVGNRMTIVFYDTETGNPVRQIIHASDLIDNPKFSISSDGNSIMKTDTDRVRVWDCATGKAVYTYDGDPDVYERPARVEFAPTGDRMSVIHNRRLEIRKKSDGALLAERPMPEGALSLDWSQRGDRLFVHSPVLGTIIYQVSESGETLREIGRMMLLSENKRGFDFVRGWLVTDTEGRYDSSDPNLVDGATYVLEWEGGLEPIAVSQLKSRFFEPGLLGKLLGVDDSPRRAVPPLNSLKLFPEVKLTADAKKPMRYDVELTARDNGGIGPVEVYVNGKKVSESKGTGFFTVDANQYRQFLLPEAALPEGVKNTLTVVAANESGDLASSPVSVELPTPSDLQAPPVKLWALCVGAGDYVGTGGDLSAPPKDAKSLAEALTKVGERLLPGRVQVSTLTTGEAGKNPSRAAIEQWFTETKTKAGAADVIFVFFAGHGTHKLGDASGYFFLTPDCDPGSVDKSALNVSTVSAEDLRLWLSQIPANKQVVVLDTCHSGAAASDLLGASRSLAGDYARAYESIRDATGTWILSGAAADQLSYESANLEHGMLTYSLLEAIDKASGDGLRAGTSGEMFVDVERWLSYAAARVDSLKNEVSLNGVQRPELRRSSNNASFDLGVTRAEHRGELGLRPPMPIVIFGTFDLDDEDPLGLEKAVSQALRGSTLVKPWFEISKHPGAFRLAGSYTREGGQVKVRVLVQRFDGRMDRKTLESFEVSGPETDLPGLAAAIRQGAEERILKAYRAPSSGTAPPEMLL